MNTVTGYIISGRKEVARAMYSTMGRFGEAAPVNDNTLCLLLRAKHSPIEEYRFGFDCYAPERVHTHVVRHEEIGKYVSSSRPDLTYCKEIVDGHRAFSLTINAKRLIEIMQLRLCNRAWHETKALFVAMKNEVMRLDPVVAKFLAPTCCWYDFCPEHSDKRPSCGYTSSGQFVVDRAAIMTN